LLSIDSPLPATGDTAIALAHNTTPRIWTVFLTFGAAIVGTFAFQAVAVIALVSWWATQGIDLREDVNQLPERLATTEMILLLAACGQVAMATVVFTAARLSPDPWRERLGLVASRAPVSLYPLAMMGSLIPLSIGFGFAHALTWILPADTTVQTLFESMTLADAVTFVLFIATVPAVVEEILFRGYIQQRLLKRWRPMWAIGVTSLLFALMHVMPHAVVALLPISVWWGVVAWRTGSVYPTILCHAFINGGVNIWRMLVKFGDISESTQTICISIILIASLVCFLLAIRTLWLQDQNLYPGSVESLVSQNSPETA
jgi:uncharacterized protein